MEEKSTVYGINRFLCVLTDPAKNLWLLLLNVILAIAIIFGIKEFSVVEICVVIVANAVMIINFLTHSPKELTVEGSAVAFDEYIRMSPEGFCMIRVKGKMHWLRVNYTVSDVKDIEFHQNAFERIFNVGRLSFSGKATATAERDFDRVDPKNSFKIYGIKKFSSFRKSFTA